MPVRPSLIDVVAAGDYRASLEALRDTLATTLASCGVREAAPLSKQLADVLKQLDDLDDRTHTPDEVDRLLAGRAARLAGSPIHIYERNDNDPVPS